MVSTIIQAAIAKAIYHGQKEPAITYAKNRWGELAPVTKALVNPIVTGTTGAGLVNGKRLRDEFVQAVFSGSILGRLQGVIDAPAYARVNVETAPITAPFVGEHGFTPAFQGAYGVTLIGARKVALITVVTAELLLATSGDAEAIVSGQLQRALSRGMDAAFIGAQARDTASPAGIGSVAVQIPYGVSAAASIGAGIQAFTGDLTRASLVVNPLTAVSLRSPTETGITATGGTYAGIGVITSYAVPANRAFLVDGSRVLAYIGAAEIDYSSQGSIVVDDGTGTMTSVSSSMFQSNMRAIKGTQYCDFDYAPGAAVEIALA